MLKKECPLAENRAEKRTYIIYYMFLAEENIDAIVTESSKIYSENTRASIMFFFHFSLSHRVRNSS